MEGNWLAFLLFSPVVQCGLWVSVVLKPLVFAIKISIQSILHSWPFFLPFIAVCGLKFSGISLWHPLQSVIDGLFTYLLAVCAMCFLMGAVHKADAAIKNA